MDDLLKLALAITGIALVIAVNVATFVVGYFAVAWMVANHAQ